MAASDGGEELTIKERNLLSVAYKNMINARRASWQIHLLHRKEERHGNEGHMATIRDSWSKIEYELVYICDGILRLLDSTLVTSASTDNFKVFYLKMKGDYYSYLAEFEIGTERKEATENTRSAYKSTQGDPSELDRRGCLSEPSDKPDFKRCPKMVSFEYQ
ncbi:LOW QUALITY PROTEIN: hypothetical protein RJ640_004048 [Escallonia rubra]|uniref:14-3-3 domain-containing protein n=1 Tax=Escallonia rubra TaxID=112253 RepID=A0AA88UE40_9ASTE|nr:LOW QUALITY PROTEIN: hypothetical protein RJ640_004048 [Escallonia rubra]